MVDEAESGREERVPVSLSASLRHAPGRPAPWLLVMVSGAVLLALALVAGIPDRWCLAAVASVTVVVLLSPRGPAPDRPLAWNLFALAAGLVAVGALLDSSTGSAAIEVPATVLGGLTVFAGAVALGHRRDEHFVGAALLDSAALGLVAGIVLWSLVAVRTGGDAGALHPSIELAFDVATLAQVRFLNASRTDGTRVLRLLSAGLLVGTLNDVIAALATAQVLDLPSPVLTVLGAAPFVLWCGAALDPSRAALGRGHAARRAFTLRRVLILGLAILVAPVLGVVALRRGELTLLPPLVAVHLGTVGIVVARMFGLVGRLRAQAARLAHSIDTDALTGLESEHRFTSRLDAALSSADGDRYLLAMSLSGISELNDALGRAIADDVILAASSVIRRESGRGATVARTGAGEFAVLPVDGTSRDAVADLASRIHATFQVPLAVRGLQVPAAVVLGIAELTSDCTDGAAVLRRCGHAVAVARESPSGVVWYGPSIAAGAELAVELISELRDAIAAGQLVVHYQPQVDLTTGLVVGVEALVRWAHPTRGLLPPAAFVPAAERNGAIRLLTLVVLDRSLAQCSAWDAMGHQVTVAVNLSARNLLDTALVEDVRTLLATYRLPAARLELEITETMAMLDPVRSAEVLQGLADLGVSLSVDDYGTGYGSLAYLQKLPVSRLKIDRSFVAAIGTDPVSAAIVRSTIDLARQVGLGVVAEGVEDEETLAALREMGCDVAQGFVLGRGVPAAAAQEQWQEIEDRLNEPTVPRPRARRE